MRIATHKLYNEMGDGFYEYLVITDDDTDSTDVRVIYVGQFYDQHTWVWEGFRD